MKQELLLFFHVLGTFSGIICADVNSHRCPCAEPKECEHPIKDNGINKEVLVFSHGTTDVEPWAWESFTGLVVPSSFNITNQQQANTMCTAHRNHRKFGITVEIDLQGAINETSEEANKWIRSVIEKQLDWYAEIITVDLLPFFTSDTFSTKSDHFSLVKILSYMKASVIKQSAVVKIACIVPWSPPCAENEASCEFTTLAKDVCHNFIINSDSFTDLDNVKCRARANIPFSKLIYGISEYNSHLIPNNMIILGVPWHGFDYTCEQLINNICHLKQLLNSSSAKIKCHFNREKMSNGDILKKHAKNLIKHIVDEFYLAPYFKYTNTVTSEQHQVWFEDQASLTHKYKLVTELELRGLAVLYGDDLVSSTSPTDLMNDKDMWTWLAHELILVNTQKPLSERLYYADAIAIVAVGFLILGTVLGILFTCFGLRSHVRKPRPPFTHDINGEFDTFTDEDPSL